MNEFQLIPEKDKGLGWIKTTAFHIVEEAQSSFRTEMIELQKLWDSYNGEFDEHKYDYLTKVEGDLTYPAKVRDIASQTVRAKINVLESEQARRKPRFKATVADKRSQEKKFEQRMKAIIDAIDASVEEQYAIIQSSMQQVQDQLNDLEQQLQVQPENEQTQAQLQQLKANMPSIRLEYGKILRFLERQGADFDSIKKKVEYFRQYNEVELVETIANAYIKALVTEQNNREDFNRGFREKIVTGKPTYITYYNEKTKKTVFKQIDSTRAFYSQNSSNRWTDDGLWCCTLEYQSLSEAIAEFDLSKVEASEVATYSPSDNTMMYSYNGNVAVFSEVRANQREKTGIPVWRIWWLSPREWWHKKSPSKYGEDQFYHHLVTDRNKANIKKDDILERHILYDRYHAVVIGDKVCRSDGRDLHVFRRDDLPGYVFLPLVARTFNTESEKPYSLVKRTEDLRELYNIIWYSLELNVVLAGVRGMVMDKSQKPDNMSTKQWQYYRRLGTMWIETMKKGRKVPATFNQFQNYDDSLSQSIGTTYELLNGIDGMMSKILGITDPRLGQTVAKDPVHNVMMSQEQSSLVTEIQYYEADTVYARALMQYLNLVFRYELDEGKVINFLDEDLQDVLFRIPSGIMDKSDFEIRAWNNIQEDHMLDIIRQNAMTQIPIDGMAALFRVDSLVEMDHRLSQIITDQETRKTNNQMQIDTNKAQEEQRTMQLKAELEQYSSEMKYRIDEAKLKLDEIKLQTDIEYKKWEVEFKEKELEAKKDIDLLKTASENEVESAYLQETIRSNKTEEQLQLMSQRLEALINMANLTVDRENAKDKKEVDLKNVDLKETRRKNNIKD